MVDWEMSTLGDPLADLGLTLMYWADPGDADWLRPDQKRGSAPSPRAYRTDATAMPGFLTRAQ